MVKYCRVDDDVNIILNLNRLILQFYHESALWMITYLRYTQENTSEY